MLDPLQDDQDLRNDLLGVKPDDAVAVPDVELPKLSDVVVTGNPTQAPKAKAPANIPDAPLPAPAGQTQAERVSQALYAAGTGTRLPDSFFTRPSDDRQKDITLQNAREGLMRKYAEKDAKAKADLEGADKNSQTTVNARNLWAATPGGAAVKEKMGAAWYLLSANDVAAMGGKKVIEQLGKSESEVAKTDRVDKQIEGHLHNTEEAGNQARITEGVKQGGRVDLLGQKQEGDMALQKFKDEGPKGAYARAELQADKAREQFNLRFQQTQDNEVRQAVKDLPKGTVSAFEAASKIDRLINNMGGADKIRGLGLGVGAIPNGAVARDVDELRRNYQLLKIQFNHDYFGANFTSTEQAQGKKAIANADGATTVGEILDSLDILRNLTNNAMRQATGGWTDRVYEEVAKNLAKDRGPLMSPTPQIDTRKGGAYEIQPNAPTPQPQAPASAATPSKSAGPHPIDTTVPVDDSGNGAPKDLTTVKVRSKATGKVKILTPDAARKVLADPGFEQVK